MKTYRVVLDTVYDGVNGILHEGSKSECELVLKVFEKYNGGKNISMEEV